MSQPYLGEIRLFGFIFAPAGWASCDGQLLPIAENDTLFQLLGTTYGGDGQDTFQLPDLRGRAPISSGQGPGLADYVLGEPAGSTSVALTLDQLAAHTHLPQANDQPGDQRDPFSIEPPEGHRWAGSGQAQYSLSSVDTAMNPALVGATGGSQSHPNESPYLAVNFCIALVGVFPSPS